MKVSGWFLIVTAVFIASLIAANIIAVKLVVVAGLLLPAAVIIFPLSYIVGDVLTEVYGYSKARRVIWLGFLANLIVVAAIWIAGPVTGGIQIIGNRVTEADELTLAFDDPALSINDSEITAIGSGQAIRIAPGGSSGNLANVIVGVVGSGDNAVAVLNQGLINTGNITEGTGYNVFLVTDGVIRLPRDSTTLQGVSRGMVTDLARQLNIPVSEEMLQPYDLYTADEVFFSGTSPCVLPVTRVDKREVNDGKPGPITQQLLAAWSETVGVDLVDQALRFDRG